jgi:2-polyprenyl-3-methyl-5-hydroxy-6-metoxy-1,4-benzoquinol methylase
VAGGVYVIGRLFFGMPANNQLVAAIVLLAFAGMQFTILGLLGEYLVRAYHAAQNLPLYINITRLAQGRLKAIERYRQGGKLLDVGCAAGFLLDEARRRGWETRGVEVSRFALEYARWELNLDVFTGSLDAAKLSEQEFDVVVLYFVLEHLRDPLALLQEICRILKPGGLLSVAVPNIAGLYFLLNQEAWIAERVCHQSHFYEFSPRTLRRILARAGMRVVALTSEGRYTRGHALAGWVKRLRIGNILLAQAVKA